MSKPLNVKYKTFHHIELGEVFSEWKPLNLKLQNISSSVFFFYFFFSPVVVDVLVT
jgi:hypothetical protein